VLKIVTGFVQPGLTGGSEDAYVRHMLIRARNNGWRVVVFNSRGCGDSPVTTPQVKVNIVVADKPKSRFGFVLNLTLDEHNYYM